METERLLLQTSRGELHALAWGERDAPSVLAVHGGFGVAQNFLDLGGRLARSYRVVALDLPGRGQSFWSQAPSIDYRMPAIAQLIAEACDHLEIGKLRWIGTSLGGSIGIHAAAGPLEDRITHIVLNDIGPTLPDHLTESIRAGMRAQPRLDSLGQMAEILKSGLGELAGPPRSDSFWVGKAGNFTRRLPDGGFTFHQDPRIEHHLVEGRGDFEVWECFGAMPAKPMVIHGCKSAVLTHEIVARMCEARPDLLVADYEDWGHAPFLDGAEDADLINRFFQS